MTKWDIFQCLSTPSLSSQLFYSTVFLANVKIWAWEIRKQKNPKSQYFSLSVTLFERFDFLKICFTILAKTRCWTAEYSFLVRMT